MRSRPPHACGNFYHVFMRGNGRQAIFRDNEDRDTFETCVVSAVAHYRSEIHAYCWMTNHVHLLFRAGEQPIHRTVHHFSTQYARQFNKKYEMVGHLFQGRHGRRLIEGDEHLLQVLRYIHRNPLEARMIDDLRQYTWSSYPDYAEPDRLGFTRTEFILELFGSDQQNAREALIAFTIDNEFPTIMNPWSTWQEIVNEACRRFETTHEELCGSNSNRSCSKARCWIAEAAIAAELGSMSWVAKRLRRTPSALSRSMKVNKQS